VHEWLERQREYCHGERVFCFKRRAKDDRLTKELPLGGSLKGWDEACTAARVKYFVLPRPSSPA
jgi:hypothetical protein